MFWLSDVDFTIHEDHLTPLPIQIETRAPNIYKIQSPSLSSQHVGFGLLKITMPVGNPARIYVAKLAF